jgi:hypothetical protein
MYLACHPISSLKLLVRVLRDTGIESDGAHLENQRVRRWLQSLVVFEERPCTRAIEPVLAGRYPGLAPGGGQVPPAW